MTTPVRTNTAINNPTRRRQFDRVGGAVRDGFFITFEAESATANRSRKGLDSARKRKHSFGRPEGPATGLLGSGSPRDIG